MRLGFNIGSTVYCCKCDWITGYNTLDEADLGLRTHLRDVHHRFMVSREDAGTRNGEQIPRCTWTGPAWKGFGDGDKYRKELLGG